jgi:hypothetical protein
LPSTAESQSSFTVLDWIAALVAVCGILGLLVFPLAGRTYAGMFEDFGAGASLPLLTRLAISVWFPPTLSVPASASLALGLAASRPLMKRRLWVVGAFVLGWGALGVCVVGLYLPIFVLADAIRAE